jgi:hypothetical protein
LGSPASGWYVCLGAGGSKWKGKNRTEKRKKVENRKSERVSGVKIHQQDINRGAVLPRGREGDRPGEDRA